MTLADDRVRSSRRLSCIARWPSRSRLGYSIAHMKHLFLSFVTIVALCASAFGQAPLDLKPDDTMRSVLERQVGQTVDLRMKSGEKIGGKVEKVTDKLAHLSQLTGAEFYDAIVEIDGIAAVAVRTKTK